MTSGNLYSLFSSSVGGGGGGLPDTYETFLKAEHRYADLSFL